MAFNKMSRITRVGMKKDKLKPILNGFNVDLEPHDGIAKFTYTGRGWICWRNGVILGHGFADCSPYWLDQYCQLVNNDFTKTFFINTGHHVPKFGTKAFKDWHDTESSERGYKNFESKTELLSELKFDLMQ